MYCFYAVFAISSKVHMIESSDKSIVSIKLLHLWFKFIDNKLRFV